MSLGEAVEKTFRGDDLCGMCKMVQSAKQSEDDSHAKVPGQKLPEKIYVATKVEVLVFASPAQQCDGVVPGVAQLMSVERSAPPGPPPRLAA
jgi:hypothetical protein